MGTPAASSRGKLGTFSIADFAHWNPAVKDDCLKLFLGFYYCIAVSGTPSTRTSASTRVVGTPKPTSKGPKPQQPEIVAKCSKYHLVEKGESCYSIEQAEKISAKNFQRWNTGVKRDCSNLLFGLYVCVGVA